MLISIFFLETLFRAINFVQKYKLFVRGANEYETKQPPYFCTSLKITAPLWVLRTGPEVSHYISGNTDVYRSFDCRVT